MQTVPEAAAGGRASFDTEPPADASARSTPSNHRSSSARTRSCRPRKSTSLPSDLGEENRSSSSSGNSRSSSTRRMVEPTAPVAPTIATRIATHANRRHLLWGPFHQRGAVRASEDRPSAGKVQAEPASVVHHPVVAAAQQEEVRYRGGSPIGPVLDVVSVAPRRWAIAAREPAPTVPDHHSAPHRGRHHRGAPSNVQGFGSPRRDHPGDRGIARDPPRHVHRNRAGVGQAPALGVRVPGLRAPEAVHAHGQGDMGPLPSDLRPVGSV